MQPNAPKSPPSRLRAVKNYSAKLISHRFTAKHDSKRGEILALAKEDKQFVVKFWQFLEQEYALKKEK